MDQNTFHSTILQRIIQIQPYLQDQIEKSRFRIQYDTESPSSQGQNQLVNSQRPLVSHLDHSLSKNSFHEQRRDLNYASMTTSPGSLSANTNYEEDKSSFSFFSSPTDSEVPSSPNVKYLPKLMEESRKINKDSQNRVKPRKSYKKTVHWTKEQDGQIIDLVSQLGQKWTSIGKYFNRTGKQVRDRYLNKLRPDLKNGGWTRNEENTLCELVKELGHKWREIAEQMPGRAENQVKNRYYSLQKTENLRKLIMSKRTEISREHAKTKNFENCWIFEDVDKYFSFGQSKDFKNNSQNDL